MRARIEVSVQERERLIEHAHHRFLSTKTEDLTHGGGRFGSAYKRDEVLRELGACLDEIDKLRSELKLYDDEARTARATTS